MPQMKTIATPPLTPQEQAHVDKGDRVYIVQEVPGPLWRVISVSKDTCVVLGAPSWPEPAEGYSDKEYAVSIAEGFAALSEKKPMVRPTL